MAKAKKKQQKKQKRGGALMGRSDIPYAQRLAMQHRDNIVVNRNHSAKVALYCLSVAIHEVKGVGYKNYDGSRYYHGEQIKPPHESVDVTELNKRIAAMELPDYLQLLPKRDYGVYMLGEWGHAEKGENHEE